MHLTTTTIAPSLFFHSVALRLARLIFVIAAVLATALAMRSATATAAVGTESVKMKFDVPAGNAERSLKEFSAQSGLDVLFVTESVAQVKTNAVRGLFTPREAIERMLMATALIATQDAQTGALRVRRDADPNVVRAAPLPGDRPTSDPIVSADRTSRATGSVTGIVLDGSSGRFLEGAEISVGGAAAAIATTERDGSFTLRNVPAGTHSILVAYPGLPARTVSAIVASGGTAHLGTVRLSTEILQLGEFTVNGTKEGMAQALALQKASDQTMLIAAGDQFGDIIEGNIAEYLKFVPGIGIDYVGGDARAIALRGLSSTHTIVSIDGNQMASAGSGEDDRRFETSQISINNVETVEIYKTLTPDQRADGTGGSINMVTKSAFDREGSRFDYNVFLLGNSDNLRLGKVAMQANQRTHVIRPNADFNYAIRLTPNLGLNANYKHSDSFVDSPRRFNTWEYNPAAGGSSDNPYLRGVQIGRQPKLTQRHAFALKVDYRLAEATTLSASGQWNWADLIWLSRNASFNVGALPTSYSRDEFVNGAAGAGSITNATNRRRQYGTTYHFTSTLKHRFGAADRLRASVYWSEADGKYRDLNEGFVSVFSPTLTGNQISFTNITGDSPAIRATNPAFPGDPDYFRKLTSFRTNTRSYNYRPQTGLDTRKGLNADFAHDFDTRLPLTMRVGGAADRVERTISRQTFNVPAAVPQLTVPELAAVADTLHTFSLGYGFGTFETGDLYKLSSTQGATAMQLANDQRRAISEDNNAAFFRFDIKPLASLIVVTGARYEKRELTAQGVTVTAARSRPVSASIDYANWFPSLNLKYSLSRQWILRAGVTRTIGHPSYEDLIPTVTDPNPLNAGARGSLSVPNPNLEPFFVKNYDLTLERYFGSSGVATISVFRKDTKNFIGRAASADLETLPRSQIDALVAEYGIDPSEVDRYVVSQATNGRSTKLQGLELSVSQTLRFLPKPFNNVGVQASFTNIDLTSPDRITAQEQLRAANTKTASLAFNWRWRKLGVLVTGAFADDVYLRSAVAAGGVAQQFFLAARVKTDVRLDYAFHRRLIVYTQFRALTGGAREDFSVNTANGFRRETQRFDFGDPTIALGVKGSF